QEMQLAQMWHGVVALVMIVIIIAHIYIGSLGMEGAFDAMGTGMVDENWAREHHDLWVAEIEGEPAEGDD
ncbi:MAG: formate dehydrogenase subunit gamma, partial [Rhodospirillales bacterium]|nr:formate dehydrogenase subunit gamma [Rhodospirillales bacterium]